MNAHVRGVDDGLWRLFRSQATLRQQSLKAALMAAIRLYLKNAPDAKDD